VHGSACSRPLSLAPPPLQSVARATVLRKEILIPPSPPLQSAASRDCSKKGPLQSAIPARFSPVRHPRAVPLSSPPLSKEGLERRTGRSAPVRHPRHSRAVPLQSAAQSAIPARFSPVLHPRAFPLSPPPLSKEGLSQDGRSAPP
jgi:hypothetical protein